MTSFNWLLLVSKKVNVFRAFINFLFVELYNWVVPKSLSTQLPENGGTHRKIMRKTKSTNQECDIS